MTSSSDASMGDCLLMASSPSCRWERKSNCFELATTIRAQWLHLENVYCYEFVLRWPMMTWIVDVAMEWGHLAKVMFWTISSSFDNFHVANGVIFYHSLIFRSWPASGSSCSWSLHPSSSSSVSRLPRLFLFNPSSDNFSSVVDMTVTPSVRNICNTCGLN